MHITKQMCINQRKQKTKGIYKMKKSKIDEMREFLTETLPPIIARSEVEKLTGGLVKRSTLSSYDSKGQGVSNPIKFTSVDGVRGKVAYRRDDLVNWIIDRMVVDDTPAQTAIA